MMPKLANKSQCTGCTACVNMCPRHCIQMKKDKAGFLFPEIIEQSVCIDCGTCEQLCPVLKNKGFDSNLPVNAYAAFSKNELLRMESSSGGIFSELADVILESSGLVWGAGYNVNGMVKHICVNNKMELSKLRGAKYSQSILEDSFQILKKQLKSGKQVLFSGTPCQVAGLKAFLKQDYDNLICIDFVCHGVPSPMVWDKYIKYRAQNDNGGQIASYINLRNKESGWSKYSYSVEFLYSNDNRYLCKNSADPFMRFFVDDYILRESCSDCHFKGYNRVSDITLGDFWGIWDVCPEMDDGKGTSLVLLHSQKGKQLLQAISDKIQIQEVSLEQASQMNPSILKSSIHQPDREAVLKTIAEDEFQTALHFIQQNSSICKLIFAKMKSYMNKIKMFD